MPNQGNAPSKREPEIVQKIPSKPDPIKEQRGSPKSELKTGTDEMNSDSQQKTEIPEKPKVPQEKEPVKDPKEANNNEPIKENKTEQKNHQINAEKEVPKKEKANDPKEASNKEVEIQIPIPKVPQNQATDPKKNEKQNNNTTKNEQEETLPGWRTVEPGPKPNRADHRENPYFIEPWCTYIRKKDGKQVKPKFHHNSKNVTDRGKLESQKLDETKVNCCLALFNAYEISGAVSNTGCAAIDKKSFQNVKVIADYKIELKYTVLGGKVSRRRKEGGKYSIMQYNNCQSQSNLTKKVMNGVFGPLIMRSCEQLPSPQAYSVKLVPQIIKSRLSLVNSNFF